MRKELIIGAIIIALSVTALLVIGTTKPQQKAELAGTRYVEIAGPSGFINTPEPVTIGQFVGEKVILVDFMTYSCINCQRTFPYVTKWYETYKDDGLVIIGIHTPEFAFEKDIENVRRAMEEHGITYPVVLDNDYATWNAYGNRYWPRKYLIDIRGNVVYDHIGEGAYEETEAKIKELLAERAEVLGEQLEADGSLVSAAVPKTVNQARSPETYFGSARNEFLENGIPGTAGEQTLTLPNAPSFNKLYLGGTWDITPEYAQSSGDDAAVVYRYVARDVFLVAEADEPVDIEVWQDGSLLTTITVETSTLYDLVRNTVAGEHTLELRIKGTGARLYAFTFG